MSRHYHAAQSPALQRSDLEHGVLRSCPAEYLAQSKSRCPGSELMAAVSGPTLVES